MLMEINWIFKRMIVFGSGMSTDDVFNLKHQGVVQKMTTGCQRHLWTAPYYPLVYFGDPRGSLKK